MNLIDLVDARKRKEHFSKDLNILGISRKTLMNLLDRKIGSGVFGSTYSVKLPNFGDIVVKIFKKKGYSSLREFSAMSLANKARPSNVPFPYAVSEDVLVMSSCEGIALDCIDSKSINNLAEILTEIHFKKYNFFDLPDRFSTKEISPYERAKEQARFAKRYLNGYLHFEDKVTRYSILKGFERILFELESKKDSFQDGKFSLIHNDLHKNNILIGSKNFSLIDWGGAYIADPSMDIAKLFFKMNFSKEFEELFLERYKSTIKLDNMLDRIKIYGSLARVISYSWRIEVLNNIGFKKSLPDGINPEKFYNGLEDDRDFIVNY